MGPSHIDDISTADDCNFQSDTTHLLLFYFHPLIFFSCIQYTSFFSHPCPFLSFCSGLLPVISLSSIFFCLSFLFSHHLPFALFLLLPLFFHPSLTFMSHLIDFFLLGALSHLQRFLYFFFIFVFPQSLPELISCFLSLALCYDPFVCFFSSFSISLLTVYFILFLCFPLSNSALFSIQQTRLVTWVSGSIFKMSLAK